MSILEVKDASSLYKVARKKEVVKGSGWKYRCLHDMMEAQLRGKTPTISDKQQKQRVKDHKVCVQSSDRRHPQLS